MKEYQSLSHTRWDCKYHVVFIPKKRRKRIFGVLRKQLGEIFHEPASAQGSKDRRRAHHAGSRSHVDQYSAEVCGIERDGVHQGKERDSDSEALRRASEEFHGRGILGSGILRLDGRAG